MGLDLALPGIRRLAPAVRRWSPSFARRSEARVRAERREIWPAAVLTGALTAAGMAACAWCFARSSGARLPWVFTQWVAEHALWGTAVGALVSLIVRAGRRTDPLLATHAECRAAACRLVLWCVSLGFVCLLALASPAAWSTVAPAVGLLMGCGICYLSTQLALGVWGAQSRTARGIHPARAAVVVLVLTAPLASGVLTSPDKGFRPPETLWEAWHVMLGA